MINTKYLANYFTNMFNTYGQSLGKQFKIFADEGELKSAVKLYGQKPIEFTSGIVEIVGSTLTSVLGVKLNTYTAQVKLFIDLDLDGYAEDRESVNLIKIRDIITDILKNENNKTEDIVIDGTTYNNTITVDYPATGIKSNIGFINDCLPMYCTFNLAMFQNGLNANDFKIIVNGVDLPITELTIDRTKTAEQNNFTKDTSTKTIIQTNGLSLNFVCPALTDNKFTDLVMRDVLYGSNFALDVRIKTIRLGDDAEPLYSKSFIGTFGDTSSSLKLGTNVGLNISIIEAKANILDYSYTEQWETSIVYDISVNYQAYDNTTVYWGDGSYTYTKDANYLSHTYTDNLSKHTIRVFKGG